jgi:hypothetical protein
MRSLLSTIVALGVLASPALAGQKAASKIVLEQWDAAYLQGARAGYVHTLAEELDRDGQKLIRTTIELRLKVKRFNDLIDLAMDVGDVATPGDGKVVGTFMRQHVATGKKLEINGVVDGDQLRLTLDGKQALKPAPWNEGVVGIFKQQTLLKDRQIKEGDKFEYTAFEPSVNLVLKNQVEAKGYDEIELPGAKMKVRLLRVENRPERLEKVQLPALITWVDARLEQFVSETEIPGLGKFRMVRTTKAAALAPGSAVNVTDIGLSQLVKLKQPIAKPYDTSKAVYRVQIRDDADPESAFAQDGRQQASNVKGDSFELQVNSTNTGQPAKEAKAPGPEFTQSSYFITSADKRVRELAAAAILDEADAWRKAVRIERWVHDHMTVTNDQALATADHVARTLQGDCTEFAMLTAAMCRAVGVPSRTAVGLIYANVGGQPAFAFHMWTEVWVDGTWRPLDATLGKGRIGATHLKIGDQSWHMARDMTPLLPVLRVLGRVRIDVIRMEW